MKYLFALVALFISGLLFLPRGGTVVRNLPLLLCLITMFVGVLVFKLLKKACFNMRIFRTLSRAGFSISKQKFRILRSCILAERDETLYQIAMLIKNYSKVRYHFADDNTIEFYKTTLTMYKTQKVSGKFSIGSTEVNCVGRKKLHWFELNSPKQIKKFVVFDRLPSRMTDTQKTYDLSAGDTIGKSEICVYDYASFERYIHSK